MRKTKQDFYIYHIVEAVAGTLYRMAPRNRPRGMDKIMSYVIEQLESVCVEVVNNRYLFMTTEEFHEWLTDMLKRCPEFCNLNLSQNEYDKDISVDDESRPKFAFTSAYDVETEDSWRDDFIDLDAAIRNIYDCIIAAHEETDCFLCDHAETEMCHYCILHYKKNLKIIRIIMNVQTNRMTLLNMLVGVIQVVQKELPFAVEIALRKIVALLTISAKILM